MRRSHPVAAALAALGLALIAGSGATCQPPADPDGNRAGATPLALGATHADSLECPSGCGGHGGDCGDWYQTRVEGPGKLLVEVRNTGERASDNGIAVSLADAKGKIVANARAIGTEPAELEWRVAPGSYYVAVTPIDPKQKGAQTYEVRATYEAPPPPPPAPPPPPPPPKFETHTSAVLEAEGPAGRPTTVLLEAGRAAGMRAGLRGRLVDAGRTIGEIEIIEVYDQGSRARLAAPPTAPITPTTEAQIDVPVEGHQ